MPRVLFFPYTLLSHYLRSIQAARFIKNDYDIHFAANPIYDKYVLQEGFGTFYSPTLEAEEVIRLSSQFNFSWLNESALEQSFLAQVRAIEKLQPALVVGDNSFTLRLAADKTGVPYINIQNAYMTKHYALVRKMSRLHPKTTQVEMLPRPLYNAVVKYAELWNMRKVHAPFRSLRKKYHLPEMATLSDELEGNYNLLCDLPEIFPQKTLPANYTFCGPLMYENDTTDEWLLQALKNGKPGILVTMGSSGSFTSVEMLNDLRFACYNIIAAGDKQKVLNAPHIIHRDFVNARSLQGYIQLFICHSGNGTMYEALRQGLPLLTHPYIFEQEWNEQRVLDWQLGESLVGVKDATQLQNLIERWLPQTNTGNLIRFKQLLAVQKPSVVIREVFSKALA